MVDSHAPDRRAEIAIPGTLERNQELLMAVVWNHGLRHHPRVSVSLQERELPGAVVHIRISFKGASTASNIPSYGEARLGF